MNVKYRIHQVSVGWLVQINRRYRGFVAFQWETMAFCKTMDEAVDYLFALKEINT